MSLPFDAETGRASVRGRVGVDANGDGTIDFGPFSSAEVVWSDAKPRRYVLLDFWGTWCGPCLAEFPTLRTARERFADRGFEILGIDYEKGATLEQARAVVKERNVTWPNVVGGELLRRLDALIRP